MSTDAPSLDITRFSHALLTGRAPGGYRAELPRRPSPAPGPRVRYLRDLIVRSTCSWLFRSGGASKRRVVLGDTRREGQLWSPDIWRALDLRFSARSLDLLCASYELQGEARHSLDPVDDEAPLGDLLFRHVLLAELARARGGWVELRTALRGAPLGSPISALLLREGRAPTDGEVALLQERGALLFPYVSDALAGDWLTSSDEPGSWPAQAQRDEQLRVCFELWAEGARARQRPDLLCLLAHYLKRRLSRQGGRSGVLSWAQGFASRVSESIADRQEVLASISAPFECGAILEAEKGRVTRLSYVERSAADQTYLSDHHELTQPIAADLRAISQHLRGEVG